MPADPMEAKVRMKPTLGRRCPKGRGKNVVWECRRTGVCHRHIWLRKDCRSTTETNHA